MQERVGEDKSRREGLGPVPKFQRCRNRKVSTGGRAAQKDPVSIYPEARTIPHCPAECGHYLFVKSGIRGGPVGQVVIHGHHSSICP
ncbi:hypothetical protein D9M72_622500 [compost metagenome]